MKKKLLAGLQAKTLVYKLRQTQLIAYLSLLLNVTLFMTLVYVLFSLRK